MGFGYSYGNTEPDQAIDHDTKTACEQVAPVVMLVFVHNVENCLTDDKALEGLLIDIGINDMDYHIKNGDELVASFVNDYDRDIFFDALTGTWPDRGLTKYNGVVDYLRLFADYCKKHGIGFKVSGGGYLDEVWFNAIESDDEDHYPQRLDGTGRLIEFGSQAAYNWLVEEHIKAKE